MLRLLQLCNKLWQPWDSFNNMISARGSKSSSVALSERQGIPCTGHQCRATQRDKQLFMLTFTSKANLALPINQTYMPLDCKMKPKLSALL